MINATQNTPFFTIVYSCVWLVGTYRSDVILYHVSRPISKVLTYYVLLCVTDTLERHHQQAETDDEGIERDAGECDDEPSTSAHHITLAHIMEVRLALLCPFIDYENSESVRSLVYQMCTT